MKLDRTFLKKLWNNEKVLCPNCGKTNLIKLHKNKRDNNDFKCPQCGKIYRTINILNDLLNEKE